MYRSHLHPYFLHTVDIQEAVWKEKKLIPKELDFLFFKEFSKEDIHKLIN